MFLHLQRASLKSHLLMGFFISLVPLIVLVWQSARLQSDLSASWIRFSENSMQLVQAAVSMDGQLTDIERSVKQFEVLQGAEIAQLAQQQFARYLDLLSSVCSEASTATENLCQEQTLKTAALAERFQLSEPKENDRLIKEIHQHQDKLMELFWQNVDEQKQRQIEQGEQKQRVLNRWTIVIAGLTLLLVLLVSRNITQPVKRLEGRILHIGEYRNQAEKPDGEFSGPREFLTINQRLEWLSHRLNELERLRQSFLRHASHELKTPLASIIESSSILKEGLLGEMSPAQIEVLDILVDSGHRLGHLTERLLDYNYLLQVQKLQVVRFNPTETLSSIFERYQPFFEKRHQQVKIDSHLTDLRTDKTLFARLADNLISNAQAYGDSQGQVLIQLQQINHDWQLVVANTGPKLTAEQAQPLFEPFYRTEHPRHGALKGSGLGLSIVRDCVSLLAGDVQIVHLPGFDFSICVTVPMDKIERDV